MARTPIPRFNIEDENESEKENENENENSIDAQSSHGHDNPTFSNNDITDDIQQSNTSNDVDTLRVSFHKDSSTVEIDHRHDSTQPLDIDERR